MALIGSCKGNNQVQNPIPYIPVNRTININDPQYVKLQQLNGFVYLPNEGYRGVVVMNDNQDGFVAFDQACTYETDRECSKVVFDENGWYLQCGHFDAGEFLPCCNSRFDRFGGVTQGPAVIPLKQYQVHVNGPVLTIQN